MKNPHSRKTLKSASSPTGKNIAVKISTDLYIEYIFPDMLQKTRENDSTTS